METIAIVIVMALVLIALAIWSVGLVIWYRPMGGSEKMMKKLDDEIQSNQKAIEDAKKKREKKTKKKVAKKDKNVVAKKDEPKTIPCIFGETWKKLEYGTVVENKYFISSFGRVWNTDTKKMIFASYSKSRSGMMVHLLHKNGCYAGVLLGNLVATAYIGKKDTRVFRAVPIDGDEMNLRASNLRWKKVR